MPLSPRRWRAGHLLGAWIVYWLLLIGVTLERALTLGWRLSRRGQHGSVSAGFDDGRFQLTVHDGAHAAWTGAADATTLALWLAGPPLLLWALWLVLRPRRDSVADRAPGFVGPGHRRAGALGAADPIPEMRARADVSGAYRRADRGDPG